VPVSTEHVSLNTAKSWAKRIHRSLNQQGHAVPLSSCQTALAKALGCSQWQALMQHLTVSSSEILDTASPSPGKTLFPGEHLDSILADGDRENQRLTPDELMKILDRLGDACHRQETERLYFEKRQPQDIIHVSMGAGKRKPSGALLSDALINAILLWAVPVAGGFSKNITAKYTIEVATLSAFPVGEDLCLVFKTHEQPDARSATVEELRAATG
jgi:hypothetical protein